MPAHSVDPRIDEWREHPAVEEDAGGDARQEGKGELHLAHEALVGLTARAYPGSRQTGEPGSRCGSDQRAVMLERVRAAGRGFYLAVWAMLAARFMSYPPSATLV